MKSRHIFKKCYLFPKNSKPKLSIKYFGDEHSVPCDIVSKKIYDYYSILSPQLFYFIDQQYVKTIM